MEPWPAQFVQGTNFRGILSRIFFAVVSLKYLGGFTKEDMVML